MLLNTRLRTDVCLLIIVSAALTLLWAPNLRYPLVSDPVGYAHLSRSIFETWTYQIRGEPNDVFVPMHSILSYGFIALLGMNIGMKMASLVYGILMTWAVFLFLRQLSPEDPSLARLTAIGIALSFPITWLLSVGNADTLYGLLFFLSLIVYQKAEHNPVWYWLLGLLMGITLLTRYMGISLFCIVGTHALLCRRAHLKHPAFWGQFLLGLGLFSLWFIRHKWTFGTWFSTFHVNFQLMDATPVWLRIVRNIWFYILPHHSVAFLYPFFLYGLLRYWKRYLLCTLSLPLSLILCYAYPSVTSRFLITTIPIMLFFAALCIRDISLRVPRSVMFLGCALIIFGQLLSTCLYTSPRCNSWIDRTQLLPLIPRNASISQESVESLQEAVDWVNDHAEKGSTIISPHILREDMDVWRSSGRLRSDLLLDVLPSCTRLTYSLSPAGNPPPQSAFAFRSVNEPVVVVHRIQPEDCDQTLGYDPEERYW